MRLVRAFLLAMSALAPMGCGSGGGAPTHREAVGRSLPPPGSIPGLAVTVETDKPVYAVGEPILITVAVINTGDTSRTLHYPTPSELHMWGYIIAQDGKIVTYEYWEGHGLAFPAVVGVREYLPGVTNLFRYAMPLREATNDPQRRLQPGTYQVYTRLPALAWEGAVTYRHDTPVPASEPVTIQITP